MLLALNLLVRTRGLPHNRGLTTRCWLGYAYAGDTTMAGGETVSQGPLEPLFQVRILARQPLVKRRVPGQPGGGVYDVASPS